MIFALPPSIVGISIVVPSAASAIDNGNSKNNKDLQQERSDEINNSISGELEKLNELFKSGSISEEDFQKAKSFWKN